MIFNSAGLHDAHRALANEVNRLDAAQMTHLEFPIVIDASCNDSEQEVAISASK